MAKRDAHGFKLGDHLLSGRTVYDHHGIYVGGGEVIRPTLAARDLARGARAAPKKQLQSFPLLGPME